MSNAIFHTLGCRFGLLPDQKNGEMSYAALPSQIVGLICIGWLRQCRTDDLIDDIAPVLTGSKVQQPSGTITTYHFLKQLLQPVIQQLSWLSGVRTRAQRSGLWRSTKYLEIHYDDWRRTIDGQGAFSKKRSRARCLGLFICTFAVYLSIYTTLRSPWPCLQSEEAVAVGDVHQLLSSKAHEVQESKWPIEIQGFAAASSQDPQARL